MTQQQAALKLHALVDEFVKEQEFDHEEFTNWIDEFQEWLDAQPREKFND